jgi:hypothetical protein
MMSFEDLKAGARVRGLTGPEIAEIISVARYGNDAANVTYRFDGKVGERLIYRGEEVAFALETPGQSFSFKADGDLLRLASEALRIRLAYGSH